MSWPWSYGSWIYNYLFNQCLSPLTLWVRIWLMARCTRYNIMRQSLSMTCDRSVAFSKSGTLYQNETVCLLVWWAVVWQLDLQLPVHWWGKPEYPVETTDLSQVTWQPLSHNIVSSTPLCLFARYSRFTFCVRQYVQTLVLVFFVSFLIFLPSFQC
jgi:hypothetical protein